jgi:hypothetical protein
MSWSDKLKGAIGAVKDTGAGAAIQRWLAREMADYGELLAFTFNSRERLVQMDLMLKGEREKLTVQVTDYELLQQGDGDYIVVRSARASREWVNAVLRNFVIGKPHRIPEQYSSMARMVLGV